MLARNPVSRARDEIQIGTSQVAKDVLERSLSRCVVRNARHPEMQRLPGSVRHLYIIAYLYIT